MIRMQDIKRAALRIAEQFQPRRIILFGSYAYGTPTKDSDVDLLVLMDGRRRVHNQGIRIREAITFGFPVDLLVRSPEEFDRRIAMGDYFLREVQQKGKVLYEGTDARVGEEGRRRLRHRAARGPRKKIAQLR